MILAEISVLVEHKVLHFSHSKSRLARNARLHGIPSFNIKTTLLEHFFNTLCFSITRLKDHKGKFIIFQGCQLLKKNLTLVPLLVLYPTEIKAFQANFLV